MEDPRNFPNASGVITWIRNARRGAIVWDQLCEAKDAFPTVRMVEMGTSDLEKLEKSCAGQPALYRAFKLTHHTDVGGIVLDSCMTPEMLTWSLGQSVSVPTAAGFRPVCD